ncbi:Crp/Fnr family transcriptional regulator [Mucilaginibacter inviolabilis]|uniref:Crp/Fnr family transcriptional regulator n=1 Tax=Mucilaginibacter inviolabilis TaxID=2714892 RepID=UPI001F2FFF4E|nr:Crp/Fnr family transcriptional regulator [Mucilaginibacter inviolabilis]
MTLAVYYPPYIFPIFDFHMHAGFEAYLKENMQLPDDEFRLMCSFAVERKLHRKQMLLQEGEICRFKIFVCKGLIRTYRTSEDGTEHIIQFSPENFWVTEPDSLHNGTPSRYYIDVLEDSEIIFWTKRDFDFLYAQVPRLKNFTERLISRNVTLGRDRIFSTISATPEEKYDEFVQTYPSVFARVPLHMIASYLGLSLKTLSRVRHAQLKR